MVTAAPWICFLSYPLKLLPSNVSIPPSVCGRRSRGWNRLHPRACAGSSKGLNTDERAMAQAAVKVTQLLQSQPSAVQVLEILAFCSIKGLRIPPNIWDRERLESQALGYLADERMSRIKTGERWKSLSESEKITILHTVCNAEGDVTYIDPKTGYTVFSFYAHLKRGDCCGVKRNEPGDEEYERTHRCRHCPYTDAGYIGNAKIQALNDRIHVIDYVRQSVGEAWKNNSTPVSSLCFADDAESNRSTTAAGSGASETGDRPNRTTMGVVSENADPEEKNWNCKSCQDKQSVKCTRCNGWTFLITPEIMKCAQCDAKGHHPCMECTSYRPPPLTSFYS